ncbi:MAG TPA: complex I NDUFA9 subunit family protein [Methylophilaceae bacterium]|nr:complex I NDUFA9 subunit family protein [Methylophilaceae bacterium]HAJ71710.1 complex I NDUFA9 subunit family protein [Methylophilaceae bacterium]
MKKITVLGGSGFVGTSLVARLDAIGYQVTVLTRKRELAKHLILLPKVHVIECDLAQQQKLKSLLAGSDIVINLVGILHESGNSTFEKMHHQLPRRLAQLCEELNIPRLIQMSALQASKSAPSKYLRSKAAGEEAVFEYSKKLNITIFRPSIIFGRSDNFFNLFAKLVKVLPVIFLAKPHAKFQPIWVENVVSCIVNALEDSVTYDKVYELGGPQVYTLQELVTKVMTVLNKPRPIIGLNDRLSFLQGWAMELSPIPLMSRDNIRSMQVDNVTGQNNAHALGVTLMPLEAIVPEYLTNATPRGAYLDYRCAAGRIINAKR